MRYKLSSAILNGFTEGLAEVGNKYALPKDLAKEIVVTSAGFTKAFMAGELVHGKTLEEVSTNDADSFDHAFKQGEDA